MLLDDLGRKALDIALEKVSEKRAPRRKLAQAILRIQEEKGGKRGRIYF
jgi:hypothetical protein